MEVGDIALAALEHLDGEVAAKMKPALATAANAVGKDPAATIAAWGVSFIGICNVVGVDPVETVAVLNYVLGVSAMAVADEKIGGDAE